MLWGDRTNRYKLLLLLFLLLLSLLLLSQLLSLPFSLLLLSLYYYSNYNFRASAESEEGRSLGQGLADLEEAREEVVAEVLNAPKRRVDNEVSRLSDSVYVLQMHCKVIEDITKKYESSLFRTRMSIFACTATTILLPSSLLVSDLFSFYTVLPDAQVYLAGASGKV